MHAGGLEPPIGQLGRHGAIADFSHVRRALEEPLRAICANAGAEASVVVNRVVEGKGSFGFNAQTEAYGDLVGMGVVDPTKVTRTALQNAASVAGLLLTTDCIVVNEPKKEDKDAHHDHHDDMGGGMGGMGGMGGGMGGMGGMPGMM